MVSLHRFCFPNPPPTPAPGARSGDKENYSRNKLQCTGILISLPANRVEPEGWWEREECVPPPLVPSPPQFPRSLRGGRCDVIFLYSITSRPLQVRRWLARCGCLLAEAAATAWRGRIRTSSPRPAHPGRLHIWLTTLTDLQNRDRVCVQIYSGLLTVAPIDPAACGRPVETRGHPYAEAAATAQRKASPR